MFIDLLFWIQSSYSFKGYRVTKFHTSTVNSFSYVYFCKCKCFCAFHYKTKTVSSYVLDDRHQDWKKPICTQSGQKTVTPALRQTGQVINNSNSWYKILQRSRVDNKQKQNVCSFLAVEISLKLPLCHWWNHSTPLYFHSTLKRGWQLFCLGCVHMTSDYWNHFTWRVYLYFLEE